MDQHRTLPDPDRHDPIASQQDLHDLWAKLMGKLGFAAPQLWLMFIDGANRPTGVVTKIEELPRLPERDASDNLAGMCGELIEEMFPGGSVAFLYARPGDDPAGHDDHGWARGLLEACRRNGTECRPVHFANDDALHVLSLDDLGLPESAA